MNGSILDNGGEDAGKCNAYEEFSVRKRTKRVVASHDPSELTAYLEGLL